MRPRPKRLRRPTGDFAAAARMRRGRRRHSRPRDCAHRRSAFLSVGTVAADMSARPFPRLVGLVLRSFYPDPANPCKSEKFLKSKKPVEPTTRNFTSRSPTVDRAVVDIRPQAGAADEPIAAAPQSACCRHDGPALPGIGPGRRWPRRTAGCCGRSRGSRPANPGGNARSASSNA